MRFVLLALLLLVAGSTWAQRLTRERVYTGASVYSFGSSRLIAPRHALTTLASRLPQQPGYWERGVIVDPQLDTTTTALRFYHLVPSIPRLAPQGGYLYTFGEPSTQPAGFQNITLRRYRADLTQRWARTFDLYPGGEDIPNGLLATSDAYFISAYSSYNSHRTRAIVLRADTAGTLLWQKNFGWSVSDFTMDMQFTQQGYLLLYGITNNLATSTIELKLLLLNQQGDSLRALHYAPLGAGRDVAGGGTFIDTVLPLRDGSFLCLTGVDSVGGPPLPLAMKVDAQLQPSWTKVWRYQPPGIPTPGRAQSRFGHAVELADGSVLVLAYFVNQPATVALPIYLLRLEGATGREMARYLLPSQVCNRPQAYQLLADGDSAAYILGACSAGPGGALLQAPYAARVSLRGLPGVITAVAGPHVAEAEARLGAPYPNPTTHAVHVPYRRPAPGPAIVNLYDALGRRARSIKVPAGLSGELVVPLVGLPAGVYMLRYEQSGIPAKPGRRLLIQP